MYTRIFQISDFNFEAQPNQFSCIKSLHPPSLMIGEQSRRILTFFIISRWKWVTQSLTHLVTYPESWQDWTQKCSAWKDFWDIADMDKCPQDKCVWTIVVVKDVICCRCFQNPLFKIWSKSGQEQLRYCCLKVCVAGGGVCVNLF